ncbi:MAG: hypothetical protein DRP29_08735 [Thermodesulfobacteriota bacterium]|nr:MAG: hypothetical protein DRP29_08735 [Thermodesulfobacteriota bacterium]
MKKIYLFKNNEKEVFMKDRFEEELVEEVKRIRKGLEILIEEVKGVKEELEVLRRKLIKKLDEVEREIRFLG